MKAHFPTHRFFSIDRMRQLTFILFGSKYYKIYFSLFIE